MSNEVLKAAAPSLIAALNAFKQFEADLGPDPAKFALTLGPAKLKFVGTLGLLLPVVANSEVGMAENLIAQQADKAIASLAALQAS